MNRYTFQKQAMEAFLRGENLIIQAPPGAGKTRAAVEPILEAWNQRENPTDVPSKLIVAAPMRTLVNSTYGKLNEASHDKYWRESWKPQIQTGTNPSDPRFEAKIIVTTVDQVLASFLALPYGLPKRQDNLNVGALVGAYLVFDEFHLYPQNEMMLTVLAMLELLKDVCRFTLMSATFSQRFIGQLANQLGATVIMDTPGTPIQLGIFQDVENIQTQQRTWYAYDDALSVNHVMALRGRRTLVISNTVARAQALYEEMQSHQLDIPIRLLHSQFYRSDREQLEIFLQEFETKGEVILFATQVVEVGIDVSADVLLTDCAPAASLIQRAGRCARRAGEHGQVHVFLPRDDAGQPDFIPYAAKVGSKEPDDGLRDVCERTWQALNSERVQGKVVRSHDEQWLIEQAHQISDARFLDQLNINLDTRINDILNTLADSDESARTRLIREQNSVPVFIHPAPNGDENLTRTPHLRESFGLTRGRLFRYFAELQDANVDADFYLFGCDGTTIEATPDEDERQPARYSWQAIREAGEVYSGRYIWFVLNPALVAYDARGLVLQVADSDENARISPEQERKTPDYTGYTADTYVQHITGLMQAYTSARYPYQPLHADFAYAMRRLCERTGKDYAVAEYLMRLIIALHDLGKLNRPWQAWAAAWQAQHPMPTVPNDQPLAHTDYDYRQDRALMERFKHPPRGPHAVESAEAASRVILQAAGKDRSLTAAAILAIMHHHTTTADHCGPFEAIPQSELAIRAALTACEFTGDEQDQVYVALNLKFQRGKVATPELVKRGKPDRTSSEIAWFYYVFVRTLRLCDQRSSHYVNKA